MIKSILGPKKKKEENKKEEESKTGKKKQTPGELRLRKEIAELDVPKNAQVNFNDENNIMEFQVIVDCDDEDSCWKGATYDFTFTVPPSYPHDPPRVHCNTKIFHPNINLQGNVCLNILRYEWKPVLGVNAVILGLLFLFIEPNPNDPLNHEAAELMRNDFNQFRDAVRKSLRGMTVMGESFPKLI
eukprot:CAMPEP_0114997282 /NCGR_PEP_ID=MMETSP0216-20121206/14806_1 /TAXON_ID=223996 /ORGANISM="Protocruzia adherens, Strain Boccale" /LENGTH=185 /DNA_ID=CAMNT_0002361633 /DNA_START=65 /DNA_END=622 /DNA_ORIENTATION=-